MAKKNFKGGLDSLIENSLGMRKSGKKGELKGNPIDLMPEQTTEPVADEEPKPADTPIVDTPKEETAPKEETPKTEETKPEESMPVETKPEEAKPEEVTEVADAANDSKTAEPQAQEPEPAAKEETPKVEVEIKTKIKAPTLEVESTDSEKNVFLKNLVADLRKELWLWRNGKINVQSFNATLHTHGLKYNPENNEIEEM